VKVSPSVIALLASLLLSTATLAATSPAVQPAPAVQSAPAGAANQVQVPPTPTIPIPGTPEAEQSSVEQSGPPSLFEEPTSTIGENAYIQVVLQSSRTTEAVDVFTLYPYPVKPPDWTPQPELAHTENALRGQIRNTGFANRPNLDKPYIDGGFRWYYAYKAALAKSGLTEPHTSLVEYKFCDEIMPYVAHECKIRNQFEKTRLTRYNKTKTAWERTHTELEADALRQGLTPIALTHRLFSVGQGEFPPGTWWLQVTRKTPGIKYYWSQPITATPGQRIDVVLNDDNALAIIGGW
jgi:hypothetical protein